MGNQTVVALLAKVERERDAKIAATLAAQWATALKLWCEEYEFWTTFHKRSLVLGGAKQSDDVFAETVCERVLRVLPMRVRKEKIDLRPAVEVVSELGGG